MRVSSRRIRLGVISLVWRVGCKVRRFAGLGSVNDCYGSHLADCQLAHPARIRFTIGKQFQAHDDLLVHSQYALLVMARAMIAMHVLPPTSSIILSLLDFYLCLSMSNDPNKVLDRRNPRYLTQINVPRNTYNHTGFGHCPIPNHPR